MAGKLIFDPFLGRLRRRDVPSQTGHSGKVLGTDGDEQTLPAWQAAGGGGGDVYVRVYWFESIASGSSGTLSPPSGGTIVLDQWPEGVDALAVELDASGKPTWQTPAEDDGTPVTATLDASGNWTLSGAPASYPVGIIFCYRTTVEDLDDSKTIAEVELEADAGVGGSTGSIDNAVLRADGTGGGTAQGSALKVEDVSTGGTQDHVQAKADDGASSNLALVLTPLGNGAFIVGPPPDGTTVGGNARGQYAVDFQRARSAADKVASGYCSAILGGESNKATNQYSLAGGINNWSTHVGTVALGYGNVASGNGGAVALGMGNNATGSYGSGAIGNYCRAAGYYTFACGAGGDAHIRAMWAHGANNSADYGYQDFRVLMTKEISTTDATDLLALQNYVCDLRDLSTWFCVLRFVARQDGGVSGYAERRVCIKREGTATSLVGSVQTIGTDYWEAGLATPAIAVTADDTNEALRVTITQANATSTRWTCLVDAVEVRY